jgi:hypothetical protein
VLGTQWFNSSTGKSYLYYSDAWVEIDSNGTSTASTGNLLINGGMDIAQRGTTTVTGADAYGALDRWKTRTATGGGSINSSRTVSGLTGIPSAGRFQRPSGNSDTGDLRVLQVLESVMSAPLAGQSATLSFYARAGANFSPTSSRIIAEVYSGTGTDQQWFALSGASTITSNQVSLTSTWQRFVFTMSVPSNSNQLVVNFGWVPTGTAGANDWFELTGVQLEAGAVATPFRRNAPSIQAELAACQRYYVRFTSFTSTASVGFGMMYLGTQAYVNFNLPVEMRPNTSVERSGGTINDLTSNYAISSSFLYFSSNLAVNVGFNISGGTNFRSCFLNINSGEFIAFSAEL